MAFKRIFGAALANILCYNLLMDYDIETLQNLLKEDPSNFQARRELSIMLVNQGFNEEAEGNLKYLIKYFPDDAELYYNLGIVQEKLKNFAQARIAYEKAIELSPQEDFYYNLGEVLVELKEWDDAMDCAEKAIEGKKGIRYIVEETNGTVNSYGEQIPTVVAESDFTE